MLSILGLYNYDPSIFDDMQLPLDENLDETLIDRQTLIDTICLQNAELELLYSDPLTLRKMIGLWSRTSAYTWEKLAKTLTLEYNPIWNKDGTITEHEEGTAESTAQEDVSAYNSSTFEPRNKSTGDTSSGRDLTRTEQGNIGVTSTQQLIGEEREVADFNIYDRISADFRNKFCLMVY